MGAKGREVANDREVKMAGRIGNGRVVANGISIRDSLLSGNFLGIKTQFYVSLQNISSNVKVSLLGKSYLELV